MIGAAIYSYRNNFNGDVATLKKRRTTRIKLFNLIIAGYRTVSRYDDDYFVSIAQFLMKKGYPLRLSINEDKSNIDKFFMDALFSLCPFHYQNLMINKNFNIMEWRKQFSLFEELEIKGLNYYRCRSAMPLKDFTSMPDIYKIIFTKYNQYNEAKEKLKCSYNSFHKDAVWILNKNCFISENKIYYIISYGCKDDYENMLLNKSCSSWDVTIESETDENYIDFCLRIYDNYESILSGSKRVLISEHKGKDFYLSGNFRLKITKKEKL